MYTLLIVIVMYFLNGVDALFQTNQLKKNRTIGTSNVVAVFANYGIKTCQRKCDRYSDCEAINYKRISLHCELLRGNDTVQFQEDDHFLFSVRPKLQCTQGVCCPNPCLTQQKCVGTTSGKHICVNFEKLLTDSMTSLLIGERKLQNIASGKLASQYPGNPNAALYIPPEMAIDGNKGTFPHTDTFDELIHDSIYWMVDLWDYYLITRVEIYNRADCCGMRLRNMDINIGTSEEPDKMCGHFVGPASNGQHITITCLKVIQGRFVRLTLLQPTSADFMHPAEVEVYAYV